MPLKVICSVNCSRSKDTSGDQVFRLKPRMAGLQDIQHEYLNMPIITRGYTTACVLTTLAVQMDLATPFQLYFNPSLIVKKYQVLIDVHPRINRLIFLFETVLEDTDDLPVFWPLWLYLPVQHHLYLSILSHVRRRVFQRKNCRLPLHVHLWSCFDDCKCHDSNAMALFNLSVLLLEVGSRVCEPSIPRTCLYNHASLRLESKEPICPSELLWTA